jgi:tetratricopeptide (TPR) repeat protein
MFRRSQWQNRLAHAVLVAASLVALTAYATDLAHVEALLDNGEFDDAVSLLAKEIELNPAHEAARVLLAETYEKANRIDEAEETWRTLVELSQSDSNIRRARRALSRLRRAEIDQIDFSSRGERVDPFKIPMPETKWEGLEVVEDTRYGPPIFPPPRDYEVPPFAFETQHFTVYTANERLSKVIAERSERYLDFMTERLFGNRSWAVRIPILVYPTQQDYFKHGGPPGSSGVAFHNISGQTEAILLYQLAPGSRGSSGRRPGRDGGRKLWDYGIQSVLPHELTHAMINEFFAGRTAPRWLQEAVAGRFEQTRDHFGEAARLGRKIVTGEYFRLRDLFEQEQYPARIELFYEQSAAIVLYLFETGPETMYVFLSELAAGNSHDVALSAALGIPEENAVEEFERRWAAWMTRLYVEHPAADSAEIQTTECDKLDYPICLPWVDEVDTYRGLSSWRPIDMNSLDSFAGVGNSKKDWQISGGRLRCVATGRDARGVLGIRMNEPPPLIVACRVRWSPSLSDLQDQARWFGFAQLDSDVNDTRVEALAMLRANQDYEVICILSDDLAIYVVGDDGESVCHGRYPAFHVSGDAPDIDYPLALVAYGPVNVRDIRVAHIDEFSDKPVAESREAPSPARAPVTKEADPEEEEKPPAPSRRRPRRRPKP